ncbi:MAG: phosphonoacetate hydrolase [Actinomycetota bacterium]|nr:phosphonoacetate hydrolase [Actinomycetota bacterium]
MLAPGACHSPYLLDVPSATPAVPASDAACERALGVLTGEELEPIVELVLRPLGPDRFEARAADGRVAFSRAPSGRGWRFTVDAVDGRNPLDDQSTERFAPIESELAARYPSRADNSYPFAFDTVAQLFDHPSPPDLCVIHSSAHNWEDQGGHRGEHGSLDAVQARAPFVIAGTGVRRLGMVDRACQLVDVAPTVLALLGAEPSGGIGGNGAARDDAYLARQDGEPMLDLLDGDAPRHVVGFLFDGCNPNVLYDMAARGEAPNVARLLAMGTAFRFGAMASLPTVTLANHTAILTGCHPGHHGILNNAWYDRDTRSQVITNSNETWATSMLFLDKGVDTIHSAVKRALPGSTTVSINEPADAYADYSTFDLLRRGVTMNRPPGPDELPFATERFVRPVKEYRWSSRTDHTGVDQFLGIWGGSFHGVDYPTPPTFTWCNFTLTDAAFHEGGPHSEIAYASVHDTDARLGQILDEVERRGVWDETAFFLVADHGMEESNPEVTGDWGPVLERAGIDFRDEAYGFLYLEG